MQSVLVNLASFAVIFHMTFGCGWHHGFGMAHACTHDAVTATCQHENGHDEDGHRHDEDGHYHEGGHDEDGHHHDQSSRSMLTIGVDDDCDHQHDHSGCKDDSCLITRVATPVLTPAVFFIEYLGGIENITVADAATYPGSTYDPFPECLPAATGVRSHLLLGVLTL